MKDTNDDSYLSPEVLDFCSKIGLFNAVWGTICIECEDEHLMYDFPRGDLEEIERQAYETAPDDFWVDGLHRPVLATGFIEV